MLPISYSPLQLASLQKWALFTISIVIIISAPSVWNYSPDSGIYVGTAKTLLETGRYWFNGEPNLLYYPGTSAYIALVASIGGFDFHLLHLAFGLIAIGTLFVARAYFSIEEYGWLGLLLPLVLGVNQLFQSHSTLILSDALFLFLTLFGLLTWKRFKNSNNILLFAACALIASLAPLVRFHGLFFLVAFGIATFHHLFVLRDSRAARPVLVLSIAAMATLPFILWTLRNYILHTPDTYNMANRFFFGLEGLSISDPGFREVDWIDAEWKYPFYQMLFLFGHLGDSFIGNLSKFVPLVASASAILLLMTAGIKRYFFRTNLFELLYVAFMLAMLLNQFIGGTRMYIIDRYWLPLLPFIIAISGYGLSSIFDLLSSLTARRNLTSYATAAGAFIIMLSGVFTLYEKITDERSSQISATFSIAQAIGDYVKENIPENAVLLGSDWGVTPFFTQRKSYMISRSPLPDFTLKLIAEKQPSYLVILPGLPRSDLAHELTAKYPEIFEPLFTLKNRSSSDEAQVYKIHQDMIPVSSGG